MSPIAPITLAINGAAGRMGQRLVALAHASTDFKIVAALDSPASHLLGRDAGEIAGIGPIGIALSSTCDVQFDVLIDFSLPDGTLHALDLCLARGKPIVIGTTGHSPEQRARIEQAARRIAVLLSPNMSIGVNVLLEMLRQVVEKLGPDYDIEIVESHHRRKVDAPSGTALALLATIQSARPNATVVHGREGRSGERPRDQIGMHSVRVGDVVGIHEVHIGGPGETVTLRHEALSRDVFALGALRAARWIAPRKPGLFSMQNALC